jgi:hypothetical protein
MSIATIDRPALAPSTTSTRTRRRTQKPARLTLAIGDEVLAVHAFDIGDNPNGDGLSSDGFEHALVGGDGERFQVFGCTDEAGEHANYCQGCMAYDCRHVDALLEVGLLNSF